MRCALHESASLVLNFEHVQHFMQTYYKLFGITLKNCNHFYLEWSANYNF